MFYNFIFDVRIPLMKCYTIYVEQLITNITKTTNLIYFLEISLSIHRENLMLMILPWNNHHEIFIMFWHLTLPE